MSRMNLPGSSGQSVRGLLSLILALAACSPDGQNPVSPADQAFAADGLRRECFGHDQDCGVSRNGRIAFSRFNDGQNAWALFSAKPDGSDPQPLTVPEYSVFDDVSSDWSPDGSTIVFERDYLSGISPQFFRVNFDGTGLSQLFDCAGRCLGVSEPRYSPEGGRIAFAEANGDDNALSVGIWIMNAEGGNRRQITQRNVPYASEDHAPTWSPDGRRLAFTRTYYGALPSAKQAVFVCNVDGSALHRITAWELNAVVSDWSPDGKRILFTSHYDIEPTGQEQLYVVSPDGSGVTQVRPRGLASGSNILGRYSPDGRSIVFQHLNDPYPAMPLYTMNLDGSGVTLVSSPEFGYQYPSWGTHP
jgi:Tol biopolymer transport system component